MIGYPSLFFVYDQVFMLVRRRSFRRKIMNYWFLTSDNNAVLFLYIGLDKDLIIDYWLRVDDPHIETPWLILGRRLKYLHGPTTYGAVVTRWKDKYLSFICFNWRKWLRLWKLHIMVHYDFGLWNNSDSFAIIRIRILQNMLWSILHLTL